MIGKDLERIATVLQVLFPKTSTFLHYKKDYELLFAIILSAQATDVSVNQATDVLFRKFPDLDDYRESSYDEIYQIIRPVGLCKTKATHIIKTAEILKERYQGKVPRDRESLMKLPGVGAKTAAVFLGEYYDEPYFPVDTHVKRVSIRLGLVKEGSDPIDIEKRLEKLFSGHHLIHLHRQFILFGRNICLARNPHCPSCPLNDLCRYVRTQKQKKEKNHEK